MKPFPFLVLALVVPCAASAQTTGDAVTQKEKAIAAARQRLDSLIETKGFSENKIPFAKLLDALNQRLSKESKFTVRLDRAAFGKAADKILQEEVELPPVPARMSAHLALRLALAQTAASDLEVEFVFGPGEAVITTRDRSLLTANYDIGDLLRHTRYLHETIRESGLFIGVFFLVGPDASGFDLKADPKKPDEWIVRQVISATDTTRAGWHERPPASTIRVVNGKKLIVHTAPSVHDEIQDLLHMLRKLADPAVVMNAKVYALDRPEYEKHFAPAFVDPKDKTKPRLVAKASQAQCKILNGCQPIFESDFDKLRPGERADFLRLQNAYQFQAVPGDAPPTTAFEGFAFAVRPTLSPDRRCLRLELFHDVKQLVKLTKGTMVDLKSGKELPVELPNLRKSTATEIIEIHDGQAILLAVDYRPKDKVWLVRAAPRIYIEEEEEQIRKGAIPRMLMADEKPAPPEPPDEPFVPKPPVDLPNNEDVRQILEAIVKNVLTDPEHKKMHSHYGTPGDGKFTLLPGYEITWPKGFRPTVAGFVYQELDPDECRAFKKKLLGIRLDLFEWTPSKKNPTGANVTVVLDDAIHGALGALRIEYQAKRVGKGWKVEWTTAYTH